MQIRADAGHAPTTADIKTQVISLWTAPVFGLVYLIAFIAFPGFFPPMSPQLSADQVAQFYAEHTAMIRFSMITYDLCGVMLLPFFMVIVVQMKRMTTQSHVLAYCYLTAAVSGATLFALSNIFYLTAAFRPRSSDLIQLLNDLAWMLLIAPVGAAVAMNLLLAAAVCFDRGPEPVFPRWVGYFAAATAACMAPAVFAAVVQTGPLAWNGLVSFWVRNGAFAVFVIVMFFVLRRTLQRQGRQEGRTA